MVESTIEAISHIMEPDTKKVMVFDTSGAFGSPIEIEFSIIYSLLETLEVYTPSATLSKANLIFAQLFEKTF